MSAPPDSTNHAAAGRAVGTTKAKRGTAALRRPPWAHRGQEDLPHVPEPLAVEHGVFCVYFQLDFDPSHASARWDATQHSRSFTSGWEFRSSPGASRPTPSWSSSGTRPWSRYCEFRPCLRPCCSYTPAARRLRIADPRTTGIGTHCRGWHGCRIRRIRPL